jgi:CMP-N-acetylneuraminic acid synthetase
VRIADQPPQDLPKAWVMNGAVYAVPHGRAVFAAEPSMYGDACRRYPMPAERSISIDTPEDWAERNRPFARRSRATPPSP